MIKKFIDNNLNQGIFFINYKKNFKKLIMNIESKFKHFQFNLQIVWIQELIYILQSFFLKPKKYL